MLTWILARKVIRCTINILFSLICIGLLVACDSSKPGSPLYGNVVNSSSSAQPNKNDLSSTSSDGPDHSTSSEPSSTSSDAISSAISSASPVAIEPRCVASDFKAPAEISIELLALDANFPLVTDVSFFPASEHEFYLLQQTGEVYYVSKVAEAYQSQLVIDLRDYYDVYFTPEGADSCHECGLYSLAFHPEFADNGYIYLSFTEGGVTDNGMSSHIARFETKDGGRALVFGDDERPLREDIYTLAQTTRIHNNGHIEFGPDGYLYAGFGDGGPGWGGNGKPQDVSNVFGSIIRITDTGEPAPDNKVEDGLPEIFAYGLRNPWRWSFDRVSGELWAGDVGQADIEEVNLIVNGGNYGWPCLEGSTPFGGCEPSEEMISPQWEYSHSEGLSVTGGHVYRGSALPELYGQYIYGDFVNGMLWALSEDIDTSYVRTQLLSSGKNISAFAEDGQGELYITSYAEGSVYKLVPPAADDNRLPIPQVLSQSGCFDQDQARQPAPYLQAYELNQALWSDGADKQRFFRLPEGEKIDIDDAGDFVFPVGTILIKNFLLGGELVETRLYLNQALTGWSGYSYRWEGDEAYLELQGADERIGDQQWHFPSTNECNLCHTAAAGYSLGLELAQLNRAILHPDSGEEVNQLEYLESKEIFAAPLTPAAWSEKLPSIDDTSKTLAERVRGYLHSNCSHCHRPGGTTQARMDLRYGTDMALSNLCDNEPIQHNFDLADAKLLAPGAPESSVIIKRIEADDELRMPPLATNMTDTQFVELTHAWISNLEYCETIVGPPDADFILINQGNELGLDYIDGALQFSASDQAALTRWKIVPDNDGYYRILNAQDENIMLHMEERVIAASQVEPSWWSAQWTINKSDEHFSIRNRWEPSWYLGAELVDDIVQPTVAPDAADVLWKIEQASEPE